MHCAEILRSSKHNSEEAWKPRKYKDHRTDIYICSRYNSFGGYSSKLCLVSENTQFHPKAVGQTRWETKTMKQTILDSKKKSHRKIIFTCNWNNLCRRQRSHGTTQFMMMSALISSTSCFQSKVQETSLIVVIRDFT